MPCVKRFAKKPRQSWQLDADGSTQLSTAPAADPLPGRCSHKPRFQKRSTWSQKSLSRMMRGKRFPGGQKGQKNQRTESAERTRKTKKTLAVNAQRLAGILDCSCPCFCLVFVVWWGLAPLFRRSGSRHRPQVSWITCWITRCRIPVPRRFRNRGLMKRMARWKLPWNTGGMKTWAV